MNERASNHDGFHETYANIKVCSGWDKRKNKTKKAFANFLLFALTHGYETGKQLDRIDNSGDYKPSNCRFVTPKENANNRRSNHLVTLNQETHTIAQWSDITGINKDTIKHRIADGWSNSKALVSDLREIKIECKKYGISLEDIDKYAVENNIIITKEVVHSFVLNKSHQYKKFYLGD